MNESLFKSNEFCMGVSVGLDLDQRKVIETHKKREPLMINGNLYYLQDGRERLLQEMFDKICE